MGGCGYKIIAKMVCALFSGSIKLFRFLVLASKKQSKCPHECIGQVLISTSLGVHSTNIHPVDEVTSLDTHKSRNDLIYLSFVKTEQQVISFFGSNEMRKKQQQSKFMLTDLLYFKHMSNCCNFSQVLLFKLRLPVFNCLFLILARHDDWLTNIVFVCLFENNNNNNNIKLFL